MKRCVILIVCGLFVGLGLVGCGDLREEPDSGDMPTFTCGFCQGDNCCCSGLDSECQPGTLCKVDGICEALSYFYFELQLQGTIVEQSPSGEPWDEAGLPDPYLVVYKNGSEHCRSKAVEDTLDLYASCELGTMFKEMSLVLEIFDADPAGDTLLYRGGWADRVPFEVYSTYEITNTPASVNHLQALNLRLAKLDF